MPEPSSAVLRFAKLHWARRRPPSGASRNAIRRMTVQAFTLALIWGSMPVVLLPVVEPAHQLIVACLMAGMISAGGFALSTVPSAGLAYTWTMTFASAGALLLCRIDAFAVTAAFLLIYAVFISRNVVSNGQLFLDNLRAQIVEKQLTVRHHVARDEDGVDQQKSRGDGKGVDPAQQQRSRRRKGHGPSVR